MYARVRPRMHSELEALVWFQNLEICTVQDAYLLYQVVACTHVCSIEWMLLGHARVANERVAKPNRSVLFQSSVALTKPASAIARNRL